MNALHRTPPKIPRPYPAPLAQSPTMVRFEAHLATAPDETARSQMIDAFWRDLTHSPLIEQGDNSAEEIVTFVWRDTGAAEVLLFINRLTDERRLDESLMHRIAGSDIWHLSYHTRPDWRASYAFLPLPHGAEWPWQKNNQVGIRHALDQGQQDPLNNETMLNRAGTQMSVVALSQAPSQHWLKTRTPPSPAGTVTQLATPDDLTIWIYQPPAHPADTPLPLVIMLDGEVWVGPRGHVSAQQDLPTTLDNLIADAEIPPCLVAFVDSGTTERRWKEMGEQGSQDLWIVEQLLPWVREHFSVSCDPGHVTIAGQSLGAYSALRTALRHPHLVGAALAQSPSLWQDEIALPEHPPMPHIYLEVGLHEWILQEPCASFAATLESAGATTQYVEYNGGHDYSCWRGGIADGLRVLLNPERSGAAPHATQNPR